MKNLKIMNMLLGGLLVLGSLTACGGSDSSDDPTPPPTPDPPTPTEKVLTSVKNRLYDYCFSAAVGRGYRHRAFRR